MTSETAGRPAESELERRTEKLTDAINNQRIMVTVALNMIAVKAAAIMRENPDTHPAIAVDVACYDVEVLAYVDAAQERTATSVGMTIGMLSLGIMRDLENWEALDTERDSSG